MTVVMLLCFTAITVLAQVPERPNPPRLVNDFAGILGNCQWLEDSLEKIAMETSNQICVVTMDDFGGYDKAWMAYKIGEEWGVGKKGNNNGVVILIKPKTAESKGEAFIAPGYGLEGAITDATSTRIVNQEMIPYFKENDYLGGVWAGAQVVRDLAVGEYNEEDYAQQGDGDELLSLILFTTVTAITATLAPGVVPSSSPMVATGDVAPRGAAAVPGVAAEAGAASAADPSVAAEEAAAGKASHLLISIY